MDAVFCGRVRFLSRTAPFDCALANWSCMSRSFKDDLLVNLQRTLQFVPCNTLHLHPYPGFVRVLKTLGFQESDFKALKVLEFRFWSLKVLDFLLNKIEKYLLVGR